MYHFAFNHSGRTRWITAHRRTWMKSGASDITASQKSEMEEILNAQDRTPTSRFQDIYADKRSSMIIFNLVDSELKTHYLIGQKVYKKAMRKATKIAKDRPSNITTINKLFNQSNIPIVISIGDGQKLMAAKNDCAPYSSAELSDGERNALLIAAEVLTAPQGSLLLIDEPERHLHRSIISPLLAHLFEERRDCGIVVSTHDHDLPMTIDGARVLLLRSCRFDGAGSCSWDSDELPTNGSLDDNLKRDLLGSRRKVLFVEGIDQSLDKSLYSLIFPTASVISRGSRCKVEQAVKGVRESSDLLWLEAYGIVDGDGYSPEQIEELRADGVYALNCYSIESIYYNQKVIQHTADASFENVADDVAEIALKVAMDSIKMETGRLATYIAKRKVEQAISSATPDGDKLLCPIHIQVDGKVIHDEMKSVLDMAILNEDWSTVAAKCPIKKSRALSVISKELGFRGVKHYESAARKMLLESEEVRGFIRKQFGDLYDRLNES